MTEFRPQGKEWKEWERNRERRKEVEKKGGIKG